jgi:superfamily II DNA or RNA helicase
MSAQGTDKVLTSKGYAIRKSLLSAEEVKRIETELKVAPLMHRSYQGKEDFSFRVYRESPERYYLPRRWGEDVFGLAQQNIVSEGQPLSDEARVFKGTPYEYQTAIIDKFVAGTVGGGLICVPCGRGKTFMALAIAAKLGKRFMVVVDKEFLMNQWKGEIQALLPGARIGILQGDTHQYGSEVIVGRNLSQSELKEKARAAGLKLGGTKDELVARLTEAGIDISPPSETVSYDITLCMIQTLCGRDFPERAFSDYGFTIFDECHHLGAQHFSKALLKVQTKTMLGLSATPKREDGLTKVFEWFIGTPVYWEKIREPDASVIVQPVYITSKDEVYTTVPVNWRQEPIMGRLMTNVVECKERTKQIADLIREICKDERRRVLVLSERISHLSELEALLQGLTMGYYIGGMKETERESGASSAQVLLASYAMASEAMNIKTLNCVVLATPRKNVEQSTGRILRVQANKRVVAPLIVDIVDVHGVYRSQWKKRCIYYRKCKYTISDDGKDEVDDSVELRAADENGCLFTDED